MQGRRTVARALGAELRVVIFGRFLDGTQRGILLQEIKAVARSELSWEVAEISMSPPMKSSRIENSTHRLQSVSAAPSCSKNFPAHASRGDRA